MRIALGADHGGFRLKEVLRSFLRARGVEAQDTGCFSEASVDYPDFARAVAERILSGAADQGILVCTTGVGMGIAANKFAGIRAAVCVTPYMARMARTHNDANVLVLGGKVVTEDEARAIVEEWLGNRWDDAERHRRRLAKVARHGERDAETARLSVEDAETAAAIREETVREERTINLIASENYASRAVREAQGSVLTNKYAEGYPGKRWYHGCKPADDVERLAVERARALFGAEHANVQPHCGSSANMAAYFALLEPGETMLAMSLAHGGHLTHGHRANFSGRFFRAISYGVDAATERLDYAELAHLAREHRPKVVVAGASAYPRIVDFAKFREIADSVGARLVVDMAHIAGLVAGGAHPSPIPHAEVVTSTTHKTLRGPRSGMILCRQGFAEEIDRQVFPGIQGGPLMHAVAAKAVCFREALRPEFRAYAAQTVRNAAALAEALAAAGLRLVSGGTDNHLLLVDVSPLGIAGRDAASALQRAGIVVNKNAIPFDTKSAAVTSGIRIGTPAVTTRGMREEEMRVVASHIVRALRNAGDEAALRAVAAAVEELALQFPPP